MSSHPLLAGLDEMRRHWYIFLLVGILLAVAGLFAVAFPWIVADIAVLFWGWFLILRGVLEIIGSFYSRRIGTFLLHLTIGILALILGGLIIAHPNPAVTLLVVLLAAFFLAGGATQIVAALYVRHPGWVFTLIAGIVGVIVGVIIFSLLQQSPDPEKISAWIIGTFIGIDLLFRGASYIAFALNIRTLPPPSAPGSSLTPASAPGSAPSPPSPPRA
jgi:uncharacterized membrane protein HdeD (DUF308 family)